MPLPVQVYRKDCRTGQAVRGGLPPVPAFVADASGTAIEYFRKYCERIYLLVKLSIDLYTSGFFVQSVSY
jgi:hypothetical protein